MRYISKFRKAYEPLLHPEIMYQYGREQGLSDAQIEDMIRYVTEVSRLEFYIANHRCTKFEAGLLISAGEDFHYGNVGSIDCLWIAKGVTRSYQRAIMERLHTHCETQGWKYYQRVRHVSPSKKLIITKEVI